MSDELEWLLYVDIFFDIAVAPISKGDTSIDTLLTIISEVVLTDISRSSAYDDTIIHCPLDSKYSIAICRDSCERHGVFSSIER
ncbi:MAG: hypothetical protein WAW59_00645 [Patescibacteria group bacterium]